GTRVRQRAEPAPAGTLPPMGARGPTSSARGIQHARATCADARLCRPDDRDDSRRARDSAGQEPAHFGGLKRWQGNSWGHWEGDTLVIETTGFSDRVTPRGSGVPMGPEGKVIEKITRTGPKSIRYEFIVSDPSLWDVLWGGEFPMELTDQPLFEYACHEGNYGLPNTLRGVRKEEQTRQQKAR